MFSSSAWDSRAEAESGSAAVASWVAENMTEISLIGDVPYAEVAFSTSLGVTTAKNHVVGVGSAPKRPTPPRLTPGGGQLTNSCNAEHAEPGDR